MTEPFDAGVESDESATTDPAALERLKRFGGGTLLNDMITLFLGAMPERLAAARAGVESGDAQATEMALHSLKSSCGQLGALRMQRLSAEGEEIARTGSLEGVAALVRGLDEEYPLVKAWLEQSRIVVTT